MKDVVTKIVKKHFSEEPKSINRMTSGIRNEVFLVALNNHEVIVRLNESDKSLKGSSKFIPIFKSKGVTVPEILAEDFTKTFVSYCYQVQSRIEGEDLGNVIQDLSDEQLNAIAGEISRIIDNLISLPTNGKFGPVSADEDAQLESWTLVLEKMLSTIKSRNEKTSAVGEDLISLFANLLEKYKDYFDKVPSRFYFDDMNSKNVMIYEGKFNGIVDLDGVLYGDPLDLIGTIKTSWYGTRHGEIYTNAIEESQKLTKEQKEIVTVYAILNRIYWTSEIGIQFNQNTKPEVDWDKVNINKEHINEMVNEIGSL